MADSRWQDKVNKDKFFDKPIEYTDLKKGDGVIDRFSGKKGKITKLGYNNTVTVDFGNGDVCDRNKEALFKIDGSKLVKQNAEHDQYKDTTIKNDRQKFYTKAEKDMNEVKHNEQIAVASLEELVKTKKASESDRKRIDYIDRSGNYKYIQYIYMQGDEAAPYVSRCVDDAGDRSVLEDLVVNEIVEGSSDTTDYPPYGSNDSVCIEKHDENSIWVMSYNDNIPYISLTLVVKAEPSDDDKQASSKGKTKVAGGGAGVEFNFNIGGENEIFSGIIGKDEISVLSVDNFELSSYEDRKVVGAVDFPVAGEIVDQIPKEIETVISDGIDDKPFFIVLDNDKFMYGAGWSRLSAPDTIELPAYVVIGSRNEPEYELKAKILVTIPDEVKAAYNSLDNNDEEATEAYDEASTIKEEPKIDSFASVSSIESLIKKASEEYKVKSSFSWHRGFSAFNDDIPVEAGAPVELNANGEFYVKPEYFQNDAILKNDAATYGCRVNPDNVESVASSFAANKSKTKKAGFRENIEFDPAPIDEECVQVDPNTDYIPAMRAEAIRYMRMLNNRFSNVIVDGMRFYVNERDHDFGKYCEVVLSYYGDKDDLCERAMFIENNLPLTWDDTAVLDYDPDNGGGDGSGGESFASIRNLSRLVKKADLSDDSDEVLLWIFNDEGLYKEIGRYARSAYSESKFAEKLKNFFTEIKFDKVDLNKVDWSRVAREAFDSFNEENGGEFGELGR